MTKRITVQFPDWMIESIIGQDNDNQAERIRELVQKGSMVETLEDATGKSFRELVREKGSGPTGPNTCAGGTVLCDTGQLLKGNGFVKQNPWAALSTPSADITS